MTFPRTTREHGGNNVTTLWGQNQNNFASPTPPQFFFEFERMLWTCKKRLFCPLYPPNQCNFVGLEFLWSAVINCLGPISRWLEASILLSPKPVWCFYLLLWASSLVISAATNYLLGTILLIIYILTLKCLYSPSDN